MSPKITADLTVAALQAEVGRRLREIRISQLLTQAQVADRAGIARATLIRMEKGLETDLSCFLAVLKALGRADVLEMVLPEALPSPIEMLKRAGAKPQRVRAARKGKKSAPPRPFKWGEDP